MTAIGLTAPGTTGLPATRLRPTVRGRRVLAAVAALPAVLALGYAIIGRGAALASRDAGAPAGAFTTVTVSAGDSLWSIAEEIAPSEDPRDVVSAIVRLNGLDGVMIESGQRIAIPTEYATGH